MELLADTEIGENSAQQIIGRHGAGNFSERFLCQPKLLGRRPLVERQRQQSVGIEDQAQLGPAELTERLDPAGDPGVPVEDHPHPIGVGGQGLEIVGADVELQVAEAVDSRVASESR